MVVIGSWEEELTNRAHTICMDYGLEEIETIVYFRELLKLKDCVFSNYLKNERGIDDSRIFGVLEQCIEERVMAVKNPRNILKKQLADDSIFFELIDDEDVILTEELETIFSFWDEKVNSIQNTLEEQFGSKAIEGTSIEIKPDYLLATMLDIMPKDIVKFIWKMNLTQTTVWEEVVENCYTHGIEIKIKTSSKRAARSLKNFWETLQIEYPDFS